jgi:hypothetical protein
MEANEPNRIGPFFSRSSENCESKMHTSLFVMLPILTCFARQQTSRKIDKQQHKLKERESVRERERERERDRETERGRRRKRRR